MNIVHHRKGNVGEGHRRDGISDNNDGYNNVETRNDADELEMGNEEEGNKDIENRQRLVLKTTENPCLSYYALYFYLAYP